jgi:hypothetical protein
VCDAAKEVAHICKAERCKHSRNTCSMTSMISGLQLAALTRRLLES